MARNTPPFFFSKKARSNGSGSYVVNTDEKIRAYAVQSGGVGRWHAFAVDRTMGCTIAYSNKFQPTAQAAFGSLEALLAEIAQRITKLKRGAVK